ncbi:unnamed protein product [Caenorhabditis brenneri]
MYSRFLLVSICFLTLFDFSNAETKSENFTDSQIVNIQLEALKESLVNMKVYRFQQLFDQKQVNIDTVFQPDFLFPNNVFASMGDAEFKSSLKIFTLFEPTISANRSIQALITISYRMSGKKHKMEKEVLISKDGHSPTGFVFSGFRQL